MSGSEASPVFVGRDAELELLERALDRAVGGATGTVLVGAESGVGKSRLVSQFAAKARDRALVLTGGCVEVGTALPYAPVTALLRMLVRSRRAGDVAALLPGNQAAELSVLLPEFGEQPSGGDPAMARARLFEALLTLVEALGEERPLVLAIEDAHWADRSTCDLLTFLVRNLRQAPALLIVTFRSEDTERAPLRSLIAGLGRMEGVQRIELAPLSRRDVAAQLEGILSGPPRPALINAVYQRGGGNPLFTEALVNQDGSLAAGLPWSLRDLIVARVKELPAETQQALRMTAVGGDHVTHALLTAAANLDDATLTSALRPAVTAHILISGADGYGFRHQLFREAVLADLLPGDRAVAHRGFATALAATPPDRRDATAGVQLALHWRGAHENECALAAAWQAAADAGAAFGYAQRLQMLDQVRELWPSVPDAASSTGTDYVGILELAADTARWAGEPERGLALVAAALARLDEEDDPERRAVALLRRADLRRELLQPGQLVYLVYNTIGNLITQDDQVRCFENAARHLDHDGVFVLECIVPVAPARPYRQFVDAEHIAMDSVTLEVCQYDPVTQVLDKNHVRIGANGITLSPVSLRQAYPAEFDLMARIAGLRLRDRWGGWNGEPYSASSWRHVSVYEWAPSC